MAKFWTVISYRRSCSDHSQSLWSSATNDGIFIY